VDRAESTHALGMFSLALVMLLALVPTLSVETDPSGGTESVDLAAMGVPLATRVSLGDPMPSDSGDARAWRAIPGIGPTLSGRLAHWGAQGLLQQEGDLLPVPGIGPKMAAKISPWILWREPRAHTVLTNPGPSEPHSPSGTNQ